MNFEHLFHSLVLEEMKQLMPELVDVVDDRTELING